MQTFPALLLAAFQMQALAAPTSVKVFVNSSDIPVEGKHITIPYDTTSLRFEVVPESLSARYTLEGLDNGWQVPRDDMFFMVRFLNDNGDQIAQEGFPAKGRSTGWKGTVEDSTFTPRLEMVTVPQGARYLSLAISSAGPASLVGVYAASGISVKSGGKTFLENSGMGDGASSLWVKSGTHPTMASVRNLDGTSRLPPMLVIEDDDITAHADFATGIHSLPIVTPGEVLEVRWNEAFSTAAGGEFSITYDRLPPGSYRFAAQDLSITGDPLKPVAYVSVTVPRPLWKNFWFWGAVAIAAGIVSTLIGRHLIRRRINRHLERARLIADERLRIARDLHDDLGTRLSHISLLGSFSESNCQNEEDRASFGQITAMSRELVGALSETIWMLSPKNNDLESLVAFLCRLVSELCRLKEIRCRIDAATVSRNLTVSHEFRHNISLSAKEILNNALRHSFATEIRMSIRLEGNRLLISIADDGVGLPEEAGGNGLGLDNIARRMKLLGGTCEFEDTEGGGFRVSLSAPVN